MVDILSGVKSVPSTENVIIAKLPRTFFLHSDGSDGRNLIFGE